MTIHFQRMIRFLFVIGLTIVCIVASYYLTSLTYPFIIAWFIAFLINPIVNFLQIKGRMPRPLAVIIVLVFIFAIIASLLTLIIFELISVIEYLAKSIPTHIQTFVDSFEKWIVETILPLFHQLTSMFYNLKEGQQNTIIANIKDIGTNVAASIGGILQTVVTKIPVFLTWFPFAGTVILFIVLATFFISKDWYKLKNFLATFVPKKFKKSGLSVYYDLRKALFGFFRAQLTLISITSVIVLIGLLILRVDYAVALAFMIGLIDLLPYLGTGIIFVPWIIYEFMIQDYRLGIGLTVLYVIVLVQRQLMEPKVVSTNIGVSPLSTLIAIFIGLKLFGVLGLIFGPIVLVILSALYKANVLNEIWNFIKGNES